MIEEERKREEESKLKFSRAEELKIKKQPEVQDTKSDIECDRDEDVTLY